MKLSHVSGFLQQAHAPVLLILVLVVNSCQPPPKSPVFQQTSPAEVAYHISVDEQLFSVDVFPQSLDAKDRIFLFAGGGSYRNISFDNLVVSFAALDSNGRQIPTPKVANNQWLITSPEAVKSLHYQIKPTWTDPDTPDPVLPMLGTAIEEAFAFINAQGLIGFFPTRRAASIALSFDMPETYQIGSALPGDHQGRLRAQNISHLYSSPILIGELSHTSDYLSGSEVFIHVYSDSGLIVADDLLPLIGTVLKSAEQFLGRLPLESYHMLFVFGDKQAGGVEFFNSSAFIFREAPFSEISRDLQDVIAHEYFHLILPFAVRSSATDPQSFFTARPTEHLWFIEGVTEWASDMMQLRSGQKSLQDYFVRDIREKLFREDFHSSEQSLQDISRQAARSSRDYLSVYSRGALAATLLDIHLLDTSFGKRGLIDVLIDLMIDFGPENPLPEDRFFEILKDYAGPEVEPFIAAYIEKNNPLPIGEMVSKIGITYQEFRDSEAGGSDLGMALKTDEPDIEVLWVDADVEKMGLRRGDKLLRFNQIDWNQDTHRQIIDLVSQLLPGTSYTIELRRGQKTLRVNGKTIPLRFRHLFSLPPALSPSQMRLRQTWQHNRSNRY